MKNIEKLILVNKQNRLDAGYIPLDLEYINVEVDYVSENKFMRREACFYVRELFSKARVDGCSLVAISGFRSCIRQREIYEDSIKNRGIEYTRKYIAYPGESEHQTGLALDVSCERVNYDLIEEFDRTKEGIWLKNNVQKFGFIIRYPKGGSKITGYEYEPWHIRYVGVEHAMNMREMGIRTLEEYVNKFSL